MVKSTIMRDLEDGNSRQRSDESWKNMIRSQDLVLLVIVAENAGTVLLTKLVRNREVEPFVASAAVLVIEIVKLLLCGSMCFIENNSLKGNVIKITLGSILHGAVPSILYVAQDTLVFFSLSRSPAGLFIATYQVRPKKTLIKYFIFNI